MSEVRVTEQMISGEVRSLAIVGDLTAATFTECAADLNAAAAAAPSPGLLLVDLRGLGTLSAAGARMLMDFVDRNERHGLTTHVLAGPGTEAVWTLSRHRALGVYAAPDEAIAAYAAVPVVGDDGPAVSAEDQDLIAVAERFARLTEALLAAPSVADVLRQVTTAAFRLVPKARLVSVTLRGPDGELLTPTETHGLADELDQVQYDTGQGPCVDTARVDGPGFALSDDLRKEDRWPRFADAASGHGLNSVLSTELLPAAGPGRLSGALNIYAEDPHGITETDQATALILGTHAALALSAAHTRELAELNRHHLSRALESRDVIGQAKGILMARRDLTAEQAFDLLRRTSQDLNVKLVDLAETLTTRHAELDTPTRPSAARSSD